MNVDRMQQLVAQMRALAAQAAAVPQASAASAAPTAAGSAVGQFADMLKTALDGVNAQMVHADQLQARFASGASGVSLSDVMVASQKASLSFQAALQVRNKLVTAYQDIMNIQA